MDYTSKYSDLVSIFNPDIVNISIPGSKIKIRNVSFASEGFTENLCSEYDNSITENRNFSYPVFIPADMDSKNTILLFHGLNERSWNKYLTWAYFLAEETNSYVILFPISFHINRSPVSWKDPRQMSRLLEEKTALNGEIRSSSFVNVALSSRLSEDPRRFLTSGYRTVYDIVKMMELIKDGRHEIIPASTSVNIFAYSIGAFMAEIIMIADPQGYFSNSKLFMFCGGSVFSGMNGESKYIMDKMAFERVYGYYMKVLEPEIGSRRSVIGRFVNGKLGKAFRAMIDYNRFREIRENAFLRLKDQICSIALIKDKVIPAAAILNTLQNGSRIELIDFPYSYTHENPFPLFRTSVSSEADRWFDWVFQKAGRFLS